MDGGHSFKSEKINDFHYRRKEIVCGGIAKNCFRGCKYSEATYDIFQKSGGGGGSPFRFQRH